jgi:L-aminopeptidase/D-esterase-like protein
LTAMHKGGLGSASFVLDSGITVGALVAANPVGSVTTPGERHFWAAPFEIAGEYGGLGPDPATGLTGPYRSRKAELLVPRANTTIAIVATDATLTKAQCHRLAIAAHDGIARAVVPAHTHHDGDLVFAVSTGARPATDLDLFHIGSAAAHCLSRAIARAIFHATPMPGDLLPAWSAD